MSAASRPGLPAQGRFALRQWLAALASRRAAGRCAPYSIRRNLSRVLAIQTVLFLSLVGAIFYGVASMLMGDKHDAALQTQAAVVQEIARKSVAKGGQSALVDMLAEYAPRRPGTWVRVLRADGIVLYADAAPSFDLDAAATRRIDFEVPAPDDRQPPLRGSLWMDLHSDAETLSRLVTWLVITVLAGGALSWGATTWRVRRALAPLREVEQQTRSIDADHLGRRVQLRRPVLELQPGVDQFNDLLERLERAYRQLDGFNADVAHELRTPLATLIGQAELALVRQRSAEELRETLASGLEELQRLSTMVKDMLFLASADRGVTARRGDPVSMADLARQVADFHEATLEDASLGLAVDGQAVVRVDEPLIKRALSNLIANATRHAVPGSSVVVKLEERVGGWLHLMVENEGEPIAPDNLPRIFDRFFRADAARCCGPEQTVHHGLGLAIVAAIARMHGGEPRAECRDGRTRVGFTIRIEDERSAPA